ncbi:type IV secretion system DNA-binding domain-containing protein [Ochrobactrum sp. AN78]|uniref:type IV secretion system DNA-binding domain-containing protein n=1 Tax=Ochrobactrum sp. AN78 TaxID=3039853 RepID=UPI002989CF9B|nr:type IV secretion system DNA-binding domain-containing protein [Ochrobactrum sp. AN78]MDH7793567.1 hypothetical protein [Ochrobactrum sp. AN78]
MSTAIQRRGLAFGVIIIVVLLLPLLPFALGLWSTFVVFHTSRGTPHVRLRLIGFTIVAAISTVTYNLIGQWLIGNHLTHADIGIEANSHALFWGNVWIGTSTLLLWVSWGMTGGRWKDAKPYFIALANCLFKTEPIGIHHEHIKGMQVIDWTNARPPRWINNEEPKPVSLGWVAYPSLDVEKQHTIIEGATGTGKSQMIKCAVAEILERGDTLITLDQNRDLFNTFAVIAGQKTPIDIPDKENTWSPANEIERDADWMQSAGSLLGDGTGESAEWRSMAKALFASVVAGYAKACGEVGRPFVNSEFYDLLLFEPEDQIASFVIGTPASALRQVPGPRKSRKTAVLVLPGQPHWLLSAIKALNIALSIRSRYGLRIDLG